MEQDAELRRAISLIIGAGYQIDREAFGYLKEASHSVDPSLLVRRIIEEVDKLPDKPLFISREHLRNKMKEIPPSETPAAPLIETSRSDFQPYAKEIEAELEVLSDPSDKISATGSLEDYIEYFQDRFRRLRKILNNRMEVRSASTILEVLKTPPNSKARIICIIADKRESKRGIFLQVEDQGANVTIFVPSENRELLQKSQRLMVDQVICIYATKGKDNFMIAEDIICPDVPMKKPNKASVPVYATLISDLHVGSKMFMGETFERFLLWLEGKIGNTHLKEIASHVKYVIIAGDVVDGVGIYPQQTKELEIGDIYKQYEAAARIIARIPEYIEVVIIPGNHDASRRALPQPAIPKEYAEPLYESRKIHSLGNPSAVSLHGVNVLLCHGRSLDDVVSTVPKMSFQAPDEAMKFLLQCRHLAPAYGLRTLIASERVDHLVIERVPDIFQAGHVHMMGYSTYRGVLVVNSGAWQSQTEYQREMGHTPNPGIAPIVNLNDLQVTPIDFNLAT